MDGGRDTVKWRQMLIGDFVATGEASIQTGPFGTQLAASSYVEHGIPVINVRNIGYGTLRAEKLEFVNDSTADRLSVHSLEIDDIVFGRKGAVDRHYLVNAEGKGWIQGSDCIRLRLVSDRVLAKYVSLAFLHRAHLQWMLTQSGNKATMASLNQDIIKRIPITVPPLPTQRRIAEILSAYDDLIENNQRRMKLLEESARMLYQEWFVHLRFPGHEHTKIVDGVPEGWERKQLEEIAEFRLGKMLDQKKNRGDLMPYLANINVRWGKFDLNDLREMRFEGDEIETCGLKFGDIVMCEGGEPGRCAIWKDQMPRMMIQKALHRIRSRDNIDPEYLYYSLRHAGQSGYLATLFTGATIKHLPREKLEKVTVVVPTKSLIDSFINVIRPIENQLGLLDAANKRASNARDLLLPRLMNGEIEV